MTSWHWNGVEFESCDSVPIADRGFRYGMSFFESIRVADSEPQFLEQHLQRLRQSCSACEFRCDSRAFEAAGDVLRRCGVNGLARIYVTAGDGGAAAPPQESRVYLFVEPRERPTIDACDVSIAEEICHPLLGGSKTGNYWANIDALQHAQRREKHEALLFNERAELVSACMANVFVVHSSMIRTPAIHCGARAGVIREQVMQRRDVQEGSLFVEDLLSADEVFLTNSWLGVMPVASINDRRLPSRRLAESLR